ncbi:hypothetical protein PFDG_00028 [Plasmodium falciparum Dd2]|uniref:Erythrocyte membrane protein 1 n=5 Tax=Plasmodium falciparum TaxID=5833 RepID=A0A0L7LW12_PLAF4|nr:hypothetical protein PFDG_00028 [Plasmodium falciparum Dd2]
MVLQRAAGGGGDGIDKRSAKHLLDSIGKKVYDKVHGDALQPSNGKLKGTLSLAIFEKAPEGKQTSEDPCDLNHEYHTTVTSGYDKENPCKDRPEVRFSYTEGAECDKSKIRGSNSNKDGACAPFRRLHLCDQHLEHIKHDKITRHNLLADVCEAAKFEAESLEKYRGQYQLNNSDVNINICTELARSFADIGDIVRGRDLYRGNDKEKDRLEENLRKIFKKIYDNLNDAHVQEHYKDDDKGTKNYYKLRNAWWEANRQTVWKAITCGAAGGTYFRQTCGTGTWTNEKCRCPINDVPTYFDYVPQYLRWFEEWAEDFCRKKKKYVDIVKTNCRNYSRNLYCSGNGLDCQETIRVIGHHVIGSECSKCSVWCRRYKKWIDNQKEEFLKQKKKCENEMLSKSKKKQSTKYNVYEGYDKEFYKILKSENVGGLDKFLELLNEERECQEFSNDLGKIDFKTVDGGGVGAIGGGASDSNNSNKTFSHSQYCEECPGCGVELIGNEWKEKNKGECKGGKRYNIPKGTKHNVIPVLSFGDEHKEIIEKIEQFCAESNSDSSKLTEQWKCYYGDKEYEVCTLENRNKSEEDPEEIQKTFHNFFYFWIRHLLNDSIEWRDKINNCIEKAKEGKCKNECKTDCGCFQRWIGKKKEEWGEIKKHFKTQDGFSIFGNNYDFVLENVLNIDELFQDITEAYGNSQKIQGIKDTLAKKKTQAADDATEQKNTIDLLFEYDSEEAEKCKKIQEECQPKKPTKVRNPCYGNNTYDALAGKVAQKLQQEAKEQLDRNDSRSALKANASQGKYSNQGDPDDFKKNLCGITQKHSNAIGDSKNPCNNKGKERFNVGEKWKNGGEVKMSHTDLYLPPRRQHFCTSNLEHLNTKSTGLTSDKAIHSLLGDVLLAAKKEGEDIKTKLTENDNRSSICRTMKYSFADIGDIIRGTDLWDINGDATGVQNNLKDIFSKITEELKKQHPDKFNDNDKYTNDSKHTKLRSDWWEANRDQVWKAMTCPTKNGNIQCGATPHDDYIPQRLRWMVEWAEWFCKEQSRLYEELLRDCGSCTTGKCNNDKCAKCDKQCQEYKTKIQPWADQWNEISNKYQILYWQAKIAAINGGTEKSTTTKDDKDKNVIDFLQKLHEANYGTRGPPPEAHPDRRPRRAATSKSDVYETTAGYIHQEARTRECLGQNVFCNNNGNNEYAFSLTPHEYKHACKCNENKASSPEELGRSDSFDDHQTPRPEEDEVHSSEEGEEDESEDEEKEEEVEEVHDGADEKAGAVSQPEASPTTKDVVKPPCDIVKELFSNVDTLQKACSTKYGPGKNYGWRCIPTKTSNDVTGEDGQGSRRVVRSTPESGSNSDKNGATCIPPRRRRLYVGKLEQWANKHNTETSVSQGEATEARGSEAPAPGGKESSSGGKETPSDKLRTAFIESAAVETFFLWDRYKKEWLAQKKAELQNGGLDLYSSGDGDPDNPQNKLLNGVIPPDFLRLMFYTLGDYRDILVHGGNTSDSGNTNGSNNNNIVLEASGNKEDMQKIQEKIEQILPKNGGTPLVPKSSAQTPDKWWNEHAESIWKGMICALTYTEKNPDTSARGDENKIEKDDEVYEKFFGSTADKHGTASTPTGTYKTQYDYEKVKLEDTSGAKTPSASSDTPLLSDFVLRPPYFRYLEEWGQNFCKERKKRLKQIKEECMDGSDKKYSGDGEQCDRRDTSNEVSADLEGRSCGNSCRFYKKWIKRKRKEYDKQANAYSKQKTKYEEGSKGAGLNDHNKEFCVKLGTCTDAAAFLNRLKNGPCKKDNENGGNDINFGNTEETFRPAENCKPCSSFKINCRNGNCRSGDGDTKEKCNGGTITTGNFNTMGTCTEDVVMHVSDKNANEFEGDGLDEACENAGIFTGIRKDEWKCRKVCGLHICKQEKGNGAINDQQIILVRALLKRWVEYFLEDYKKIKKKLKPCIENGNGSTCINGCNKKCNCVGEWIKLKKDEWTKIKNHYLEKNKEGDKNVTSLVTNVLETLVTQIAAANDKREQTSLDKLKTSLGCNCPENSRKNDGNENDAIDCMLNKLETKIHECKTQHENSVENSDQPHPNCGGNPPPDEEDLLLEEENPVEQPGFCPTPQQEPEPDDKCGKLEEKKDEKKEQPEQPAEEDGGAIVPSGPPGSEPEADKGPVKPAEIPKPQEPPDLSHPAVIPSLVTSTLAWSVGIGFATFTYFYLKKKTKSSVGNLFQILQIPKSDYDIPTKLSPNRYIPYTSGKYRGKRYIYLEGDSGTDSGYTDHYSDITSSESEYEEMDINDIYVPGSPKYKTLIEVVLEPSGNNTTASGNNTTASGNNTTASGKNTPSDTQNDIQNDGIPSSKITDNEWNQLKDEFISQYLQSEPNTEPNMLGYNVDNNTHPTTSHHNVEEKPFIMSIHDRNLFSGEEYNYDMFNSGNNPINISDSTNSMDSLTSNNHSPYNDKNDLYSGIDLINDALSGNHIDIYDEMLKRKENELFGTKHHTKHTNTYNVAKPARDDPITNQINLFHKWLDRHRDMCEKWKNNHERLPKLKELWENETHSGDINSGIPSGNHVLNTDVSIQIDMDNPKTKNEITNMDTNPDKSTMDTILDDLEKYNEPYYYDFYEDDIIYHDVDVEKSSMDDIYVDHNNVTNNNMDVPTKMHIEMNIVNNKKEIFEEEYPISDIWNI